MDNKLLEIVSTYEEMIEIIKNNLTKSELDRFKELEEGITALESNWYDTHDLTFIQSNIEEMTQEYQGIIKKVYEKYKTRIN